MPDGAPELLHLLHYVYVEDILERRGPHREGHLALARRWKDEGRLLMGGAVGDPPHGALFVLRLAAGRGVRRRRPVYRCRPRHQLAGRALDRRRRAVVAEGVGP
jgi:hypothetical protein